MCNLTDVVRCSIYKVIIDNPGKYRSEDILSWLSTAKTYTAYMNLGRTPVEDYVNNRIEDGDIFVKSGRLYLTPVGIITYTYLKKLIDEGNPNDHWHSRLTEFLDPKAYPQRISECV